MKYGNSFRQKNISILCILVVSVLLNACGGVPIKKESDVGINPAQQKGTMIYIPVQKIDKTGKMIPYQAMANPYLAQTGQINLSAVEGYIAARKALKDKQYSQAVTLLNQVIESDNTLAGPWLMKGDIAMTMNKLDEAGRSYQQAVDANELNVNAYIKLAKTLRMQGKYSEAQNVYANALKVWKDFPEAHLNLAVLYDVYLNNSVSSQRHMEAYLYLTNTKDEKVVEWLQEIRSRSGANPNLVLLEEPSTSNISSAEDSISGS